MSDPRLWLAGLVALPALVIGASALRIDVERLRRLAVISALAMVLAALVIAVSAPLRDFSIHTSALTSNPGGEDVLRVDALSSVLIPFAAGLWLLTVAVTPRAALLSALSGIAITFISMDFTFKIFAQPLVALAPMAVIFIAYFSHQRLPLGLPGGMIAVCVGTFLGWSLGAMPEGSVRLDYSVTLPVFTGGPLWEALTDPAVLNYFSVIFPMGIFNVVGSLQNIESAEAAGDLAERLQLLFSIPYDENWRSAYALTNGFEQRP